MAIRKIEDENVIKITKNGSSYSVTVPIEIMREFKWQEKQKVTIKKRGQTIIISDWKK